MSDVKAFTGFIAIDNTTHTSKSAAIAHSREVKVKAALQTAFGGHTVVCDQDGKTIPLDTFIAQNRDAISAALNQEVLTRKKRTPNKAKQDAAKGNASSEQA